jgi:SPP1 gp7 family putative phage head morphogenesis protein
MAKSKTYWVNRTQQLLDQQEKRDVKTTKRLAKEYGSVATSIDKEVASYYARYGKDNVIEYRKMVDSLSKSERDLLYKNYEEFARKYPDRMDLMPVRESIYKLNRLEGLQLSVRQQLLELGAIEQEEFEKAMKVAYERGYLNTMRGLGNAEAFFGVDSQTLELTLNQKWVNNENFSDRIWNNKKHLINTLNGDIRDAMIRGESYAEMQKIIRQRMDVGAFNARRLIHTENAFMLEQGKARSFINEGLERYENSAVRDSKTSDICREMDGEIFFFEDMKVGENFPPYHSFCRTTIIPIEND